MVMKDICMNLVKPSTTLVEGRTDIILHFELYGQAAVKRRKGITRSAKDSTE
jgi:hypothetical protein